MENIIPVGTKHQGVKVWLGEVSKEETHIYVAIAVSSEDDETAKAEADRVKNQEMLVLRKMGYEQVGEPLVSEDGSEGALFAVARYIFKMTAWAKEIRNMK